MSRQVDWYYHRKGWNTCAKVSRFLEAQDVTVQETIPASRKLGLSDAMALVEQADRLVVAKGKKLTQLDVGAEPPTADAVAKLMLGPTGNLRAPTLRVGRTLVVGYNEQTMVETFG